MKKITRRSFMGYSAAAALCASSWARAAGANNDIRVAVVGLGGKGRQHTGVFHRMNGVRVVALCDPDEKRLGQAAKAVKDVDKYADYRKLLENKNIDAVCTASCNHWHAPVTVWGCEAGKDIYVEKPVCHTIREGREMIRAARKHKRIVQSGTQLSSGQGCKEGFAYIKEGHIGKIVLSRGLCIENRSSIGKVSRPTPVPDHIDYDLWCGPAPKKPLMRRRLHYDWHWIWDTGNGDLGNQGIHHMNMARLAIEQDRLAPAVISVGGRFGWNDDGESANTQIIFFDYKPAPIIFEVTGMPMKKGTRQRDQYKGVRCGNVVHCEGGYYAFSESGGGAIYDKDGKKIKSFKARGAGDHQKNFIDAVRSRKPGDLTAEIADGHVSSSLCHMGNISHRLGKQAAPGRIAEEMKNYRDMSDAFERFRKHLDANEIDIEKEKAALGPLLAFDPEKEAFIGDRAEDANRMMSKKYRKGFVIAGAETA
jgi:predicted dehydrogenase